jgi:hypothetical protein
MLTGACLSVLLLSAQEVDAAKNVWVSASQWPNARTHETFAKDAVRLYGAENGTEEQKALAIYYTALRVMGHGGDYYQGPPGAETAVWDNWMIFHVYPKALCEWWGWFLIDLWKAYHNNWSFDPAVAVARKVGLNSPGEKTPVPNAGSHVEAALRYKDADGVSRWHLFDGNVGYFARVPDGDRIATPEEIQAGFPAILTKPHKPPKPYFVLSKAHGDAESDPAFRAFLGNTYPFAYSGSQRRTKYRTDLDLRVGESLRRQWFEDGKPVVCKAHKNIPILANLDGGQKYVYPNGQPKDPYNYPVQRPYFKTYPELGLNKPFGNAYSVYVPDLKSRKGALSSKGFAARGEILGAERDGVEGEIIYPIRSIYPFAESVVRGEAVGRIFVELSLDEGKTWIAAHADGETGKFAVDLGKGRWDQGLPSTYNMPDRDSQFLDYTEKAKFDAVRFTGFQYQVRLRGTGLRSLRFENTHMCNIGMLPTLLPGPNRITVDGEALPAGAVLKVEYAWMEGAETKSHVETAAKLPHAFDILVKEKDPLKVKCLHQTTSVVAR